MTSITDCRQAIELVQVYEIDWEIIFVKDLAARGVVVWYGEERIVLDNRLRVEGRSWVCRGRRFSEAERVALTEWALKVIKMYGVKRYSRKKINADEEWIGHRKIISHWEILYVDPNEDTTPYVTLSR